MAHAAIAFAKASRRRRMMACTTSIGPGATNMVTAAAVAHVNRLPVLLLPGDVFANRRPDPVLQQVEDFGDGTVSANDCFRPVSRYFDRITRPEQIIAALPRAMTVLTDPAACGPVTLALCQDVQAEAFDYPESFFAERIWTPRRARPDERELAEAARLLAHGEEAADHRRRRRALRGRRPARLRPSPSATAFRSPRRRPARARCRTTIRSTWARSASPARAPRTRSRREADVVLAVGTRLQDFTTGSWSLFGDRDGRIVSSTCSHSMPASIARSRWSPTRRPGSKRCRSARRPSRAGATGRARGEPQQADWGKAAAKVTAAVERRAAVATRR